MRVLVWRHTGLAPDFPTRRPTHGIVGARTERVDGHKGSAKRINARTHNELDGLVRASEQMQQAGK